ncbi:MAG: hypothetical protein KAT32_03440 [Candidatus Moranbacteria bacterium]|nr:hypothetical protein [Candidatus Moranbacteria bacterium]
MTPKKLSGKIYFLITVTLIYLVAYLFNENLFFSSLQKTLEMFLKIIPILIVTLGIMILVNLLITPERIRKHLLDKSKFKRYFYFILFGIIVSGPPYIIFPILKDLKDKGVSNDLLAVFLYNRNVKIPFLIVMIYYFGIKFTIINSFLIIIFSIFNGLLVKKFTD